MVALLSLALAVGAVLTLFGAIGARDQGFRGLVYHLEEGTPRLPDFRRLRPVGSPIYTQVLDVDSQSFEAGFPGVTDRFEWFAIRYSGLFEIDEDGEYRLRLISDDGSRLIIDDTIVIRNDGIHSPTTVDATVPLAAGVHCIRVDYFQGPQYDVALQLQITEGTGEYVPFYLDRYALSLVFLPDGIVGAGASTASFTQPYSPIPWLADRAPWPRFARLGTDATFRLHEQLGYVAEVTPEAALETSAGRARLIGVRRVQTGLRWGGRVLLPLAAGHDLYRVYKAPNRVGTTAEVAGGWATAYTAASGFAAAWTPLDAAGPGAWIIHGAGTLLFGVMGYAVGSFAGGKVYEVGDYVFSEVRDVVFPQDPSASDTPDTRCFQRN